jgi:hypothetical protein
MFLCLDCLIVSTSGRPRIGPSPLEDVHGGGNGLLLFLVEVLPPLAELVGDFDFPGH